MKKTVQINIAGVLFTIEEDAFDKLNNYLKSIQKYFSAFESSDEIVNDIEARIAERFMSSEANSGNIILNAEDVDSVISKMGSVADFEAMEEEVDFKEPTANNPTEPKATKQASPPVKTAVKTENQGSVKRFYRDLKRKALGGVLAGFAHYFKWDVTWVRVIYALLFLSITPLSETPASGFLLIAYLICWVAIPGNDQLEINDRIKRFYRNPDGKVIGGVSTGLASYFATDVAVVRILFVVLSFFGVGIISYLVLWIGAPVASSLTQKMELQGEPVTLENIENSVRKNLGVKDAHSENSLSKILLFPFRLISMLFSSLGDLIKHLGPVARVVAGLFITFIGLAMLLSSVAATAAFYGLTASHELFDIGSNIGRLFGEIPKLSGIFLFLATAFPGLAALLAGFSLLSNQKVGSRNFWLTSVVLWIIGIFGLSVYGTTYSLNFSQKGRVSKSDKIEAPMKNLYFDLENIDYNNEVRFDTRLRFDKSESGSIEIEKTFEARGATREVARKNASDIIYEVMVKGDTLTFDKQIRLGDEAKFRNQSLDLVVKIPQDVPFKVSPDFEQELMRQSRNLRYTYGISRERISQVTFQIDANGDLSCVDCPALSKEEKDALEQNKSNGDDQLLIDTNEDLKNKGENRQTYNFKDFDGIKVESAMTAEIRQGESYSIEVITETERDLEDMDVDMRGNTLSFEFEDAFFKDRDEVLILITTPKLEQLDLSGAAKAKVLNFETKNTLNIGLSGASMAAVDTEARKVYINASGASKLVLVGEIEDLDMDLSGASNANTTGCRINNANVNASGASSTRLGNVNNLNSKTSGASKVTRF